MKLNTSLLALAACGLGTVAAAQNANHFFADRHSMVRGPYVEFAERVAEETKGDVNFTVFAGGSLLPPAASLQGVRDGVAQVTYHAGTYTPSDLPEDNTIAALAIGLPDSMTAAMAVADFYINDEQMQGMFDRLGITFLGSYASPQYVMMCSSEITTLDQVEGKKLRTPSPVHAAWAESVGAVPVSVPSSEMFSGLEKGQLDCAINAANDLKSRSLWDVAKYTTLLNFGPYFAGWMYGMDRGAWGDLSETGRQTLIDAMPANIVNLTESYMGTVDEALAEAPDHGVTIDEPSEELIASLDEFNATEVDGLAVETGERLGAEDPAGLAERFKETYAKWEGLMADVPADDLDAIAELLRTEVYDKLDVTNYGL